MCFTVPVKALKQRNCEKGEAWLFGHPFVKERFVCSFLTLILCIFLVVLPHPSTRAEDLTVLTEEWKPLSFVGENGKPTGLAVEIVRDIMKRLNLPGSIHIVPWARAYRTALVTPNVVIFSMTQTVEREQLFKMIGPIALGKTILYAKKGSGLTITSLEEAKQLTAIGVYSDTAAQQILTQAGFTNLQLVPSPDLNIRKLMKGRIDVFSGVNLTVGELLSKEGLSRDAVEGLYTIGENRLHIAMSKATPETIVDQWKTALEKMHNDGRFERIYHRWLPGEEAPPQVERIGWKE
ncbi:MAG: transporter substrate-binding domain-containing protein [Desulfobacter sp.]|nr:MAG: transporter substrate-binding domain-containing protein [Desulfobacter sp.]